MRYKIGFRLGMVVEVAVMMMLVVKGNNGTSQKDSKRKDGMVTCHCCCHCYALYYMYDCLF